MKLFIGLMLAPWFLSELFALKCGSNSVIMNCVVIIRQFVWVVDTVHSISTGLSLFIVLIFMCCCNIYCIVFGDALYSEILWLHLIILLDYVASGGGLVRAPPSISLPASPIPPGI